MATTSTLNTINVFDSEDSYNTNKGSIGENEISLVAMGKNSGYVTEMHQDGSSWYKKYSNGWVEQGGTFTSLHNRAVTLNVPMKDSNYTILTSKTNFASAVVIVDTATTTSFKVYGRGQGGSGFNENVSGYWYVAGMGA